MAAEKSIIMSWSKCKVEVGKTGDGDTFAETLKNVGVINDKSTTISTEDGETLTATASGGVVVAEEHAETVVSITTRVKEMDFEMEKFFTGADLSTDGSTLTINTNVVNDYFSVKITPKNIGATGIKANKTSVTFHPGSSEDEGHYVDLTFKILACAADDNGKRELYKKFKVTAEDWN